MSPLGHIVERCAGSCHVCDLGAEVAIVFAARTVRPSVPRKVRCIRATAYCPQLPAPKGGLSREEEETDENAEA